MLGEQGVDVSGEQISQLLGQLGLSMDTPAATPMPVEPDNGIGDGAGPIPTPVATDSGIESLLQGIDPAQINALLQNFSLDDLAQMLGEQGVNVSAEQISQLLGQLGLSMDTPMPVEPDNGIGDGAGPIPTPVATDSGIESLLQGIDPAQINALLQNFSLDDLAQMLGEQGVNVSAEQISQLLGQLGLSMDTPMPVEPDNGIGDGAGPIPTPVATDSGIESLLQGIDPAQINALLQNFSLDDLALMLGEQGVDVSAEQISQLLGQLGLPASNSENATAFSDTNTMASTDSHQVVSDNSDTNSAANTNVDIESLLQDIDSSQFSDFFDSFSTEQLATMLSQEGLDISVSEIESLLMQAGILAT